MTLIVSLKTPDGIVIAGDSLSTMQSLQQIHADFKTECTECKHPIVFKGTIPNIHSSNTLSHAQKIFPFLGKYGVGTFGVGQILGKTTHFALRELEQQQRKKKRVTSVNEAAEIIGQFIKGRLLEQIKLETKGSKVDIDDGKYPIGFQIVGYDSDKPICIAIHIGKNIKKETFPSLGITYNGQQEVVNALFERFKSFPHERPVFHLFSLQDAIIYTEFLIKTTAIYQRFSSNLATVGGDIDIGLITPFDGFQWIKQKSLQAKLSGDPHESK